MTDRYDGDRDFYTESTEFTQKEVYPKLNYYVNFDLNGVVGTAPNAIVKTKGKSISPNLIENPTNIQSGYDFTGWYYQENGTEKKWTGSADLPEAQGVNRT